MFLEANRELFDALEECQGMAFAIERERRQKATDRG